MRIPFALVLLLITSSACSPVVSSRSYAVAMGDDPDRTGSVWSAYAEGRTVVLDGAAACAEGAVAPDGKDNASAPPAKIPDDHRATLWQIEDSSVRSATDDDKGALMLTLRNKTFGVRRVLVPSGERSACVVPATPELVAAFALEGKPVVFAPWRESCTKLEATGGDAAALLVRSEPGVAVTHEGVVLGPPSALAKSAADGGRSEKLAPWIRIAKGSVRVRADVFQDCFTPAGAAAATPPADALGAVRVDAGRCSSATEGGKPHVTCSTTLGAWEGVADDKRVSLRFVRRTFGRVDFLGGAPVDGSRWAHTVVAIATRSTSDPTLQALYDGVERSVAEAVRGADAGHIRIADGSDPAVTHRINVEASNVAVGDLQTHDVAGQTTYQKGEDTVPNPEKARAREAVASAESGRASAVQRVAQAKDGVRRAREEYANNKKLHDEALVAAQAAKRTCLSACDGYTGATERSNCKTACDVAGIAIGVGGQLTEPSRDGIASAEGEVSAAESAVAEGERSLASAKERLAGTPDTVRQPHMEPWRYTRRVYSRSLSASLAVTVETKVGAPSARTIPISAQWETGEVQADPAHNVKGETPDRGPIDRGERALPRLTSAVAKAAATELRRAIEGSERDELLHTFAVTKIESKPGYEVVDATAFRAAGPRLARAVARGGATIGTAAFHVPVTGLAAADAECLVAVAVADTEGGGPGKVTIVVNSGVYADLRARGDAWVEMCPSDFAEKKKLGLDDFVVSGSGGQRIKWGIFLAKAGVTAPRAQP